MLKEVEEFVDSLKTRCPFEVINHNLTNAQLRLQLRVAEPDIRRWVQSFKPLRRAAEEVQVGVDISKHYFEQNGEERYAWRLILHAVDVQNQLVPLAVRLTEYEEPPQLLTEVRLNASPDRNPTVREVRG